MRWWRNFSSSPHPEPVLLYATIPGFYAEVERAQRAELGDRPVIVGGDPRKKGNVQAATPDAVAKGVVPGMPMVEALGRCPGARDLRTNMRLYRETSKRLHAYFRREAEKVEPAGLDAAYLDLRGTDEPPEVIADRLRKAVAEGLRLPLRLGAAPLKFVAKIAAEESSLEGFLLIPQREVRHFLDPLEVGRLPGVGPRTVDKLASLKVETVGALKRLPRADLEAELGNHGLTILGYAEGQDVGTLRAAPHPRSISQESTLPAAELEREALEERLGGLAKDLERSLALEGLAAKRLVLKVRYDDRQTTTRSRTLEHPIDQAAELLRLAAELLDRTQVGLRGIDRVGLALSGLIRLRKDERQMDLFDDSRVEGS